MLFSARMPLSGLIELCRTMRHYLGAGLTLRDAFRQQAKSTAGPDRALSARVSEHLETGDDLETALRTEGRVLPALFLALAAVGEQTGTLPEVCKELERYYRLQQKLKRQFLAQIAWPVFQLVSGIFVLAGMLLVLGMLAPSPDKAFDPLGFGLTGVSGALAFLGIAFGGLGAVVAALFVVPRLLKRQATVDRILLRLPAVGKCLRALALSRFCLAMRLTLDTSMSTNHALAMSLRATGNAAYEAAIETAGARVKKGGELADALRRTGLFPDEFRHIVEVGEESGRLVEVMDQQSEHYQEEAERALRTLTALAGWGVWVLVAIMIIFVIFRIVLSYIGLIDQLAGP